jgi:predicted porin
LPESYRTRDYVQRAVGVDAEYSRDYWVVRGEVVWSGWDMPFVASGESQELDALGMWVEGRYRLTPRLFVAARADRLSFSRVSGTLFSGVPTTWDANVERLEFGGGWYVQRNLVARAVVQRNWRDGGRVLSRTYVSAQLAYWF